jgi:hypothetical protein
MAAEPGQSLALSRSVKPGLQHSSATRYAYKLHHSQQRMASNWNTPADGKQNVVLESIGNCGNSSCSRIDTSVAEIPHDHLGQLQLNAGPSEQ